jgi:hypothetical protein
MEMILWPLEVKQGEVWMKVFAVAAFFFSPAATLPWIQSW